jgi:hypothetical protein
MKQKANLKKGAKGPMKMKMGGDYLEMDKEVKFGGMKYQAGGMKPKQTPKMAAPKNMAKPESKENKFTAKSAMKKLYEAGGMMEECGPGRPCPNARKAAKTKKKQNKNLSGAQRRYMR